ncbi:hypothetical protein B0H13DRAFT_2493882 [Mycena leptocephala]|nr:hypothetical protein B0H13DRAFT_2493882 [Mycena leptocephala]
MDGHEAPHARGRTPTCASCIKSDTLPRVVPPASKRRGKRQGQMAEEHGGARMRRDLRAEEAGAQKLDHERKRLRIIGKGIRKGPKKLVCARKSPYGRHGEWGLEVGIIWRCQSDGPIPANPLFDHSLSEVPLHSGPALPTCGELFSHSAESAPTVQPRQTPPNKPHAPDSHHHTDDGNESGWNLSKHELSLPCIRTPHLRFHAGRWMPPFSSQRSTSGDGNAESPPRDRPTVHPPPHLARTLPSASDVAVQRISPPRDPIRFADPKKEI